jgi:hypothetical protein
VPALSVPALSAPALSAPALSAPVPSAPVERAAAGPDDDRQPRSEADKTRQRPYGCATRMAMPFRTCWML